MDARARSDVTSCGSDHDHSRSIAAALPMQKAAAYPSDPDAHRCCALGFVGDRQAGIVPDPWI